MFRIGNDCARSSKEKYWRVTHFGFSPDLRTRCLRIGTRDISESENGLPCDCPRCGVANRLQISGCQFSKKLHTEVAHTSSVAGPVGSFLHPPMNTATPMAADRGEGLSRARIKPGGRPQRVFDPALSCRNLRLQRLPVRRPMRVRHSFARRAGARV